MPNETITLGVEDAFSNPLAKMAREFAECHQRVNALATSLDTIGGSGGAAPQTASAFSMVGTSLTNLSMAFGIAQMGVAAFQNAIHSVTSFIPNAINAYQQWGMQVYEVSRNLGLTTESASGLVNAADDLGVGVANLSTGFGIFAKHLAGIEDLETTVAEGGRGFKDVLKDLGISMTDANGKMRSFDELLPAIADHFAGMQDGMEKTALAMTLFGRGGRDLVPLLNQGAEGLKKFSDETKALGLTMSQEDIMGARSWRLAKENINDSILSVQAQIARALMPTMESAAKDIAEKIPQAFAVITTFVQGNFIPVMAGIGAVLTGIAIPALITLAGVVLPVVLPLVALGGAAATVAKVWTEDWGGIRTIIENVVQAIKDLLGIHEQLSGGLTAAAQKQMEWNAKVEAIAVKLPESANKVRALGQEIFTLQQLIAQGAPQVLTDSTMNAAQAAQFAQTQFEGWKLKLQGLEGQFATFSTAATTATTNVATAAQNASNVIQTARWGPPSAADAWAFYAASVKTATFDVMAAMGQSSDQMEARSRESWQKIKDDAVQAASDVAKAMAEAAKAAGQAFTSGISGMKSALDNLSKPQGPQGAQPFGDVDFSRQTQRVAELKFQIKMANQELWEMANRWKQQDPNKVEQVKLKIQGLTLDLAEAEGKFGEMDASNAKWASSGTDAIGQVRDAFRGMIGDMITSAQLSGQISDEFAQGWRDAVGVVQTPTETIALNLKRIMDKATEGGINTQRQVTVDLSAIMKTFDGDQAELAKALNDYWSGSIGWVQKYVKEMQGMADYTGATEPTPGAGLTPAGGGAAKMKAKALVPDPQDIVEAYKPTQKALTDQGTLASANYIQAMSNEATKQALNLQKIGEGLSGGVAGGISSPASQAMLNTAITTVMSWLPVWATALLGMHSPSQVFSDIGEGIMQGLSAGIGQAGQLPVNALMGQIQEMLKAFSGLSIDPRISEMADTVSGVVGAMGDAIDTLVKLKDYVSPARAKVDAAYVDFDYIVRRLMDFGNKFVGALNYESISSFGDTANTLLGAFASGVGVMANLKDYTSPARKNIDAAYNDIVYLAGRLIALANDIKKVMDWDNVSSFADNAGKIFQMVADGVEALSRLKDYTSPARSRINAAYNDIVYLAGRLISLADAIRKTIDWDTVGKFSENADNLFAMFSRGVETLVVLKDYTSPARARIDAAYNDMIYIAGRLIALADAIRKTIDWETVGKFSENAGALISTFSAGIEALIKLKDYTSPARTNIDTAFNDIIYLAGRLIALGNAIKKVIDWDTVSKFAENAGAVFSAFSTGLNVLIQLRHYISPARSAIDSVIVDLLYIARIMIAAADGWDKDVLEAAVRFAQTAGVIGDALSKTLTPLKEAASFQSVALGAYGAIADAINRWVIGMVWLAAKFTDEGLKAAINMANTAGAIGDALEKVMEPFKKAAQFQPIATGAFGNLADAIVKWVKWMTFAFNELENAGFTVADATTMSNTVKAIGDALSGIIEPLRDAAKFEPIPTGAFGNLAKAIVSMVSEVLNLKGLLGDAVAQVKQFSTDLNLVIAPFQSVIDTLDSFYTMLDKNKGTFPNIEGPLALLQSAIESIVVHLAQMKQGDFAGKVAGLKEFASDLGTVLSPFQTAIQTVTDIYDLIDKRKGIFPLVEDALVWVSSAIESIVVHLAQMKTGDMGGKVAGLKIFATDLGIVLSPMSTVVSILSGLIDLSEKLQGGTFTFANIMVTVSQGVKDIVNAIASWQADNALLAALGSITETFTANLKNALSPISMAVSTLTSLIDLSEKLAGKTYDWGGIVARLGQAVTVVIEQWQAYATTAWLTGLLASFPEGLAAAYSNALDPLNQSIQLVSNLIGISEKLMERNYDWGGMVARIGQAITVIVEQWQAYATTDWLTELLGEFPETLKTMFSNAIDPLNQSISLISSLIGVSENLAKKAYDWGGMVSLIGQALKDIMAAWREKIDPDNLGWLPVYPEEFKDNLRNALEPLSQAVQIVSSLMGISEQLATRSYNWGLIVRRIGIALQAILLEWRGWVTGGDFLALAATFDADLAASLRNALEPLSQAVQIVSGLIGVSEQLAARSYNWSIIVRRIGLALQAILIEWKTWVEGEDFLTFIGTFPATLNANLQLALGPLSQAIQIVTSLIGVSDSLAKKAYDWTGMVNKLGQALKDIVAAWVVYAQDPSLLNMLRGFPETLNAQLTVALSPLSQTIQIVSSLIGISEALIKKTYDWTTMVELLGAALQDIVAAWLAYASNDAMLNTLRGFPSDLADALRVALDPLSQTIQIVSSLIDVSEKLTAKTYDWSLIVMMLGAAIEKILVQWQVAALNPNIIAALANFPEEFNAQLQNALSPISLAASTITTLIDLSEKLGKKARDWGLITMRLGGAIEQVLVQWSVLAQNAGVLQALRNFPTDFSTKLQNALGPIRMAVDTLNAVGDYLGLEHRGTDIPAQVQMLADDVAAFVQAFSAAAAGIDVGENVVHLGEALNAIIGPVKSYIDSFYWIWRYVSVAARSGYTGGDPNFVPQQFRDIANDLMILIKTINEAAEKLEAESPGLIQAAADFSILIKPITDAVSSVIAMFAAIEQRQRPPYFLDLVKSFGDDLVAAMSYLSTTLTIASKYGRQWHMNAYVFGYDIGHTWGIGIVDGIRSEEQAIRDEINVVGEMLRNGGMELAGMVNQVGGGGGANVAAAAAGDGGTININVSIPVQQLQTIDENKLAGMIRQQIGEIAKRNTRIFVPSISTG